MEPKPFRRHKTEGANDEIEQSNALIFARHSIGVADNQLSAMLTILVHVFPDSKNLLN
jgi:hypothetical protein